MTDEALLQLNNIGKIRGNAGWVLRDINLTVHRGEILAVVGESGSGKTTMLRLIAGLDVLDEGSISLAGQAQQRATARRQAFGYVFQEHALFPHMTVAENIAFGCKDLSRGKKAERVTEMLKLVGLSDCRERFPHQLSGGQQQRVALARALAPEPKLVLLDEPFSSLDANLRRDVREEVGAILRRVGTTAVFVTHDVEDALALADRVAVLHQGKLLQVGHPREVYERASSEKVAKLLGPVVPWKNGDGIRWVRPEALELCDPANGKRTGTVSHIRYCGSHIEVHVACEGNTLVLQSAPDNLLQEGQDVGIRHACPFFTSAENKDT